MTTVLVTDGNERSALAVVRSLGRAGHRVHVCSSLSRCLAGASRHVTDQHRIPDPLAFPDAFADSVRQMAGQVGARVILPVTDASVSAVLRHRALFEDLSLPLPSGAEFEGASDKARLAEVAGTIGIRTPIGVRIESRSEATDDVLDRISTPVVVKPVRSVVEDGTGARIRTSVLHASTSHELREIFERIPPAAYPVLVQERIQGAGLGVFLLRWEDQLLASFAHRRLREKPPSGGVSVLRESIALPEDLLQRSLRLLEAFRWRGVAMVEYKEDSGTGEPVLMELNGRFWGSLQLAIDAGVDFPRLLVAAAIGDSPAPVLEHKIGVQSRWFWGDVDHLIARIRRSGEDLRLPPETPGRGRAVLEFLSSSGPRVRGEVLRLSDPGPAVVETLAWMSRR